MIRKFHIVAIPIRIVVNRFGDHNPNGMMYVLKQNESKIKKLVNEIPFMPIDLVEPLTIRANVEDDIEVLFENQLPFPTSMHIQRAEYNVQTSDGAFVGFNQNTTVEPGATITYRWKVEREGIHIFSDLGNTLSTEQASNLNGLFGALIVQAKGSWWTHPTTGDSIDSGLYADIHHPFLPSFREYAWFFHDEMEIKDLTGQTPINPETLQPDMTHNINYRSEPMRNRLRLILQGVVCPDCSGEEVHHDSWTFGDPSTPILRSYVGDPLKIRLINGGVKETHVFHYHVHQWLFELSDIDSEIVDAQSISPQQFYTVSPLYGAGSLHGAFGDVIIHCHLYPHFGEGMWGLNRVFYTLQDGSQCYPNGVQVEALQPLPDRPLPPIPTPQKPGFPNFIPGVFGLKAPRPPLGIVGGRESTSLEINQFAPNAVPGAAFTNPCVEGVHPIRRFDIVLIQLPIVYNKQGWHDPEGRIYCLAEDEEAIRSGRKLPEPLVIQANAGDCIRINFTNKLPEIAGGNAFQLVTRTYESAMHVHFVKFDPLCADGGNVGWNYDTSILPGQTIRYQWFADVELKATFWHDHLFANFHQQHGVFAGVNIQARGSEFLDPYTGEEIKAGTQAIITHPLIPDFRELTLFVHDFALLFDKEGKPLNPPPFPGSQEDPGVMGVNYRNEPFHFRLKPDPAYVFSSFVHGDPVTPILETYNGDPVRIRLLDGAHEESHSFNLHKVRWHKERRDLDSEIAQQQELGIAESYTLEFAMEGEGDFDILYHYGSIDDLWLGAWGLLRSFKQMTKLMPLPDRPLPPKRTIPLPAKTGKVPPKAKNPGKPCPVNAPVRRFEVVAMNADIVYNKAGDHDPFGIIFALKKDVEKIKQGKLNPEPLIIRANEGDCVEITLYNQLRANFHHDGIHGYPEVPVQQEFPQSLRISMHPQMVQYDVLGSDGATVGFNPDQTVGPGESITYRWYIEQAFGAVNLWDMADVRNHRHHGAFGTLVMEQKGSTYLDPVTRENVESGNQVVISHPLLGEFREFVLLLHDGVRLVDKDGNVIFEPITEEGLEDFEDQGSRGFNYRSEHFANRLEINPDVSKVFSSEIHGDPSTPVFYAYQGDPVKIRLVTPADRARTHTFTVHGHTWQRSVDDLNSTFVPTKGQNTVGSHDNFELTYGAGSKYKIPGDYMYRSGNIRWDIELGMWGIMRVLPEPDSSLAPLMKKLEEGKEND